MKLGIMQPYFLPYIGYFQLIAMVDKFVLLDDVNYINRGWINRNRLLLNGSAHTFTIPLVGASQNKHICEIELVTEENWREKLLRTIRIAYAKAPYFEKTFYLIEEIINYPTKKLDDFLFHSICKIAKFISLDDKKIIRTSRIYNNKCLKGEERILDICLQEKADMYINPIGGVDLYDQNTFLEKGIQLHFLQSRPITYQQGKYEYVPWLSILDVLMYNEIAVVQQLLFEADQL
jgi:hypothetical protein